MPTLTSDIHPIWAPEKLRFSSTSNKTERAKTYAAISPALRLASLWIAQPQYEEFWTSMWHGQYSKSGRFGRLLRITQLKEGHEENLAKNRSVQSQALILQVWRGLYASGGLGNKPRGRGRKRKRELIDSLDA